jgi:hypothetical protein
MKSALLSQAWSFPLRASFFSDDERPVHEASIEVEFATRPEVFGERLQDGAQDAFAHPLLEPAMAGLVYGDQRHLGLVSVFQDGTPKATTPSPLINQFCSSALDLSYIGFE